MAIQGKDYDDLKQAAELLEFPSFISKITNFVGKPIEKIIDSLPVQASENIQDATNATLDKLLAFKCQPRTKV